MALQEALFIFSFDFMIKNTFFVTILLSLLFTIFVLLKPKISSSQHQLQNNINVAQKFLYEDSKNAKKIILGSSLAARLRMDSLKDFHNLSFGGLSVFDGLRVLRNTEFLPTHLYIETNLILRGEYQDFGDYLFSPLAFTGAKYIPSLRSDKKPLSIFLDYVNAARVRMTDIIIPNKKLIKKELTEQEQNIQKQKDTKLFEYLLSVNISEYKLLPDSSLMKARLQTLKNEVSYFQSKNIKIYFFEMPLNKELMTLPKSNIIRSSIRKTFPEIPYLLPDDYNYTTTDAVHLKDEEAIKYTQHLKKQMEAQR